MVKKFYDDVYLQVKNIPKGKVATYGQIADACNSPQASRAVGNALHVNPNPQLIPCHRVVDSNGKLAANFAFGGIDEQRRRLENEGVTVSDSYSVDLKKYRTNLKSIGVL